MESDQQVDSVKATTLSVFDSRLYLVVFYLAIYFPYNQFDLAECHCKCLMEFVRRIGYAPTKHILDCEAFLWKQERFRLTGYVPRLVRLDSQGSQFQVEFHQIYNMVSLVERLATESGSRPDKLLPAIESTSNVLEFDNELKKLRSSASPIPK